jgi:hypothetical protein
MQPPTTTSRHVDRGLRKQLVSLPGADRVFTLGDRCQTADSTLASFDKPSRHDSGGFLTTILMTDIVDST